MSSADAAHEFGALNTLLLVVILGLCILSAYLIKENSFYYLPESSAAIVVGLIVGCFARVVYPSNEEMNFLSLEPQLFYFLLLPPIIFEAAYSLKKRDFFANFWTISLYAVFGTIISTFVIGYLVYGIGLLGIVDIDTSSPVEALMFGALISSVDPVATLSIMGKPELNCNPLLYSLVFGESVLNDAVAIVLFNTFMSFYESGEAFTRQAVANVMLQFTIISLCSVFIGVATGLACSYLCKHTNMKKYPEYEISILFLFAYGSYSFCESIQLSGIMALFFCGVVLSHYNSHNLSTTSQVTAHNIFKCMAVLSEYFVFLYIGMGLFTGRFKHINFTFFLLCTICCLIARAINIFPLSYIANFGRARKIPLKMQSVIWFAGLRGAISFTLSQNMPGEHKQLYISTTLSIVVFTTVVCGGLTEPFLTRMGMRVNQNPDGHNLLEDGSVDCVEGMELATTGSTKRRLQAGVSTSASSSISSNSTITLDKSELKSMDVNTSPQNDIEKVLHTMEWKRSRIPTCETEVALMSRPDSPDHSPTHSNNNSAVSTPQKIPACSTRSSISSGAIAHNMATQAIQNTVTAVGQRSTSLLHRFENEYMKPIFGGKFDSDLDSSTE